MGPEPSRESRVRSQRPQPPWRSPDSGEPPHGNRKLGILAHNELGRNDGELTMIETICDADVPDELRDLAERHKQHLAELVIMLRTVGMNEEEIEAAVDQLVADYRVQLVAAAKALRRAS